MEQRLGSGFDLSWLIGTAESLRKLRVVEQRTEQLEHLKIQQINIRAVTHESDARRTRWNRFESLFVCMSLNEAPLVLHCRITP